MPKRIANEFVSSIFQCDKVLKRDASCNVLGDPLADGGQVEGALIYDRVEIWLKVVLPGHLIDVVQLEKVSGHQNVEHVFVVDLLGHVAPFIVVC